jgi:hypothetical protein
MRTITLFALLVVIMMGVFYGVIFATGEPKADMNGKIIGICHANPKDENNTQNSILVEGTVAGNSETHNISLKINNATVILKEKGKKHVNASFSEIKTGNNVVVMFTGPFLESYPPQTTAKEIIIIS